ncbi:hypothetical protein D9Q98_003802 [Chlorella vulgaris]|uniref:Uncharacterized protein n=1 Tax=Chlorella vulgaris TaxID=3077 RepID=A0A9D4TQV1_CHLVU|nr:hypothetical protein D9Q98_003802 [Chlorella vulgaris]
MLAAHTGSAVAGHGARQLSEAAAATPPAVAAAHACAEALQIPQVAMLFLVKGPLRHEAVWQAWFERAAGLLPAQAVSNALCASEARMPAALAACSSLAGGEALAGQGVLHRQHLFDVYVHPHPNFTGYAPGSLLYGRELGAPERVATKWGSHSLVDAAEALMAAALRNPRNQKFLILSESDLPLYSPEVMYQQLLSEHRSRVNACNTTAGWGLDHYRWVDRMATPFLPRELWRKSSQWFVLNRKHAQLVLDDRRVEAVFQQHCRTTWEDDGDEGWLRVCFPDEHYIPTLLAVHGLEEETDCQGSLMDVDWSRVASTSPHPWEYQPNELSDRLFEALRRPQRPGCAAAAAALAAAPAAFLPQHRLFAEAAAAAAVAESGAELEAASAGVCARLLLHQQEAAKYTAIGPACPLLARKFSDGTEKAALMALAPCDSSTLILNNGRCPGESERLISLRRRWWAAAPWVLGAASLLLCLLLVSLLVPCLLARVRPWREARLAAPLLDV